MSSSSKKLLAAAIVFIVLLIAIIPVGADIAKVDQDFGTNFEQAGLKSAKRPFILQQISPSEVIELKGRFDGTEYAGTVLLSKSVELDMVNSDEKPTLAFDMPTEKGNVKVQLFDGSSLPMKAKDQSDNTDEEFQKPYVVLSRNNDTGNIFIKAYYNDSKPDEINLENAREKNMNMVYWLIDNIL